MTDDLKKPTPQSAFKPHPPAGSRYGAGAPEGKPMAEQPRTREVAAADPTNAQYGALILENLEKVMTSQSNMSNAVGEFGSKLARFDTALELVRGEVHELRSWKKSVGDSGMMQPFVRPDGPQTTTSGEVRRISQSDLTQNKAISGLSENQVVLSDKVDVIARKLDASEKKVDALTVSQSVQTGMQTEIRNAVTGWAKQHPEIGISIATLLGVLLALATSWLQKVHP